MANMNLPEDQGAGNATPHGSNERQPARKPTPSGERWWGARILEEVVRGMFRADEEADRNEGMIETRRNATEAGSGPDSNAQPQHQSSAQAPHDVDKANETVMRLPPKGTGGQSYQDQEMTVHPRFDGQSGPGSIGKGRGERLNDAYSESVADLQRLANFYHSRGHTDRAQEIYVTLKEMLNQKRDRESRESDERNKGA